MCVPFLFTDLQMIQNVSFLVEPCLICDIFQTDRHDITEILLKGALNTIKQTNKQTNKQTDKFQTFYMSQ